MHFMTLLKGRFFIKEPAARKLLLSMKLTVFILLAAALQVSATGSSQTVTLHYRNVPPKKVFKEIIRQTGISIVWTEAQLRELEKVTIIVKDAPVEEALNICFKDQPYKFQIVNNTVVISQAIPNPGNVTSELVKSIQIPVKLTGIVLSSENKPLSGANVVLKGTKIGTTTDINGRFSLDVPDNQGTLVISYVGYTIQETSFSKAADFRIILTLPDKKVDEVVVIAYGAESRQKQTSSVASIKSSDIIKIPAAQLSTSLAGRLPGAQIVQNSGFVGSNASIAIRGAGTAPLYVIDNVVTDKAQFDVLDPGEVESVSILKDAGAAAIYGARAAGGVVVVKTKSGRKGKMNVNYRGLVSTSRTVDPLQDWTPEEELTFRNDVAINKNRMSASPDPNFKLPFDQEAFEYAKTIKPQSINNILWRNPFSQQHGLDLSGGSENITYFFSGNYSKNKGSYDRTSFDKYTLRAKVDANVSKNLKIGTNLSFNKRYTERFYWPYDWDNGEGFTLADFYRPTFNLSRLYPFYSRADGTPTTPDDPEGHPSIQPGGGFNPAEVINSVNYRHISYNTFNAIVTADLDIPQVRGLSLRVLGNYRQDNYFQKDFVGEFNNSYRVQTEGSSGIGLLKLLPLKFDAANKVVNNYGKSFTSIDERTYFDEQYQTNLFIDYTRSFGLHHLTSFIGIEQYQFNRRSISGTAENLLTSSIDQLLAANSARERRFFDGSELNQSRLSYFGRAKYDYDAKYIAEFSFREDGSFIFPSGKQFGFFPSVSAAWVVSREHFFNIKPVSTLKLRLSYGTTGYDGVDGIVTNIAPFQFQNNYNITGNYVFANATIPGLAPQSVVPNPNITWAVNKTMNAGIDLGLFKNALTFSFDYFQTKRSKILASTADVVPGTFGTGLPSVNIGEQEVTGLEFSVNYGKTKGNLNYSIGLNFGYAIEKYVSWPQAAGIPWFQQLAGKPTRGVITGFNSKGIVKDKSVIDALPQGFTQFGRPVQLGSILIEDIAGDGYKPGADGKVDWNDITVISKNAVPRINFGLPVSLGWKDFSLDIFFQGVGPYDKFVQTQNTSGSGGVFQSGDVPYFELWTEAYSQDHNPGGKYPRATGYFNDPDLTGCSTTFWKRNGAYIRLKNVNLAYSIPQKIIERTGLKGVQFNVNASNLFTISAFKEHDPEQISLDSYPILKVFSFGLNLSL